MNKEEMLAKIKEADNAYYNEDNPIMDDVTYDNLRKEYIKQYGTKDLDYVPGNVSKGLQSFKHPIAVRSLNKVQYTDVQLINKEIKRLSPVVVEPKLDGLTIVVYPKNEQSVFVTRGNGSAGEIIKYFPNKYVGKNTSSYAIRGEAYLTKKNFDLINKEQEAKGLKKFANARNAAAGILRRLDKSDYTDYIDFICYDVLGYDISETDKIEYIKNNTVFTTVQFYELDNKDNIKYLSDLYTKLNNEDIPIDGLVIKSNIDKSLERFGSTEHHPLNAIAYKYEQEQVLTTLRKIIWQTGREAITPVAIFDAVEIDGTIVKQASLSNWPNIKSLGLMLNDTVMVEKKNQIIPQIVQMVQHNKDSKEILLPKVCPICGTKLMHKRMNTKSTLKCSRQDLIELYCPNDNCRGRLANNINYVFSKQCLNAKGLSIETIYKLIDSKKVSCITDVFDVKVEDFLQLEGFAEKSANDLYNTIQNCRKNVPLSIFIPACGITNIGFEAGKLLARKYKTFENISDIIDTHNVDSLLEINGIGEILANKIISLKFILAFNNLYEYIKPLDEKDAEIKKDHKTFVITGTLSKPRKFYEELIKKNGDIVGSAVSGKTTA